MNTFPFRCLIALLFLTNGCAQNSIEETLRSLNKGSVPYISVEELATSAGAVLLDTRSREEFEVSHLRNSIWVGYDHFNSDSILKAVPDKNKTVVVYCSVGVRSEDIGEKLLENGYTDVRNLYGGIFEWTNRGYPVIDPEGKETLKVHAYNKRWGSLLRKAEKVY